MEVATRPAFDAASIAVRRDPSPQGRADIELSLLGGFDLRRASEPVATPAGAQRLLAFLALQDRPAPRSYVAGMLWADVVEQRAMASLRSALWRLRRTGLDLVRSGPGGLALAPGVEVDARSASSLARCAAEGIAPPDEARAVGVLALELLPGWYDEEWLIIERERRREPRLRALEAICQRFADAGMYGHAIEAASAAIGIEPLRESAHRALIAASLAEGNRAGALEHYSRYERMLSQELGLGPSKEIAELIEALGAAPNGNGSNGAAPNGPAPNGSGRVVL